LRAHNRYLLVYSGNIIFFILLEFYIFHAKMDAGSLYIALCAIVEAYLHVNKLEDSGGFDLLIELSLLFIEFVMIEFEGHAFQRYIEPCL
jgi:hypothetical protein